MGTNKYTLPKTEFCAGCSFLTKVELFDDVYDYFCDVLKYHLEMNEVGCPKKCRWCKVNEL